MGQSKLTLQILHAYAAVGVQCSYLDCQNDTKLVKARLTGVSNEGIETTYSRKKRGCNGDYISHVGHNNRDLLKFKLLLRPLSDLTKEIEHNGERFVPIERLSERCELQHKLFGIQNTLDLRVVDYQKLLEWHFDVFSLLDSGDALPLTAPPSVTGDEG
jgi:hypothetical protein